MLRVFKITDHFNQKIFSKKEKKLQQNKAEKMQCGKTVRTFQ